MIDLDELTETQEYKCAFCGATEFKVSFTNFRKLSMEQAVVTAHQILPNTTVPTLADVYCAKCGMHGISFPMNTIYTFEDESFKEQYEIPKKNEEIIPKSEERQKQAIVVDVIIRNHKGEIAFVKRKNDPWKGQYALPGGHVEDDENVASAAIREVKEECGIDIDLKTVIGIHSNPGRDPRGHYVSIVFYAEAKTEDLKGGDDATEAVWRSLVERPDKLAADHLQMLSDYCSWSMMQGPEIGFEII